MSGRHAEPGPNRKREFIIAAKPGVTIDLVAVERAAAGQIDDSEGAGDLFPPRGHQGPCRICGVTGKMTEEHLPPRTVQYRRRMQGVTLQDWFSMEDLDVPARGRVIQGGVSGYMLCPECNNRSGQYAREYQEWARGAAEVVRSLGQTPEEIDAQDAYPYVTLSVRDLYPGRLARSVIAMMLSISGSPELGERYPILRELALGEAHAPIPETLRLFMVLYAGPSIRIVGGPAGQAIIDTETGVVTRMLEVAYPPFAFQMILEGNPERASGVDISAFTEIGLDERKDFQIEDLLIGFGHTPYPGDYRTRAKVLAEAEHGD